MNGRKIANLLQWMPKPQHVDDKLYVIIVLLWFFFSDGPSHTEVVVVVFVPSLWIFVGVTCAPQDCTILICCTLQTKGNHRIFKSSRLLSCGTSRVFDVLAWATNDIILRYCGCLCVLGIVTIGFLSLHSGENSSVETTWLARTETRHDFLAHRDLLRVSLYGRQGRDSVLGPQ